MSKAYFEDWEDATITPWALGGVNISRSSVGTPMDGSFDLRLATTAGGGSANLNLAPPSISVIGSRRGLRTQHCFKFKMEVLPTGGQLIVMGHNTTGAGLGLWAATVNDGSNKLCLQGVDLSQTLGATVLVAGTEYLIDLDFRTERDTGCFMQAWINGVLEVTHRDGAGSSSSDGINVCVLGIAGGKGTVTARWGDIYNWIGADPQ